MKLNLFPPLYTGTHSRAFAATLRHSGPPPHDAGYLMQRRSREKKQVPMHPSIVFFEISRSPLPQSAQLRGRWKPFQRWADHGRRAGVADHPMRFSGKPYRARTTAQERPFHTQAHHPGCGGPRHLPDPDGDWIPWRRRCVEMKVWKRKKKKMCTVRGPCDGPVTPREPVVRASTRSDRRKTERDPG